MRQIPEVSGSVRRMSGQLYRPWEESLLNQYGCGPACQSCCRQLLLTVATTKRVAHSGTCAIPQGAGFLDYFPGLWNINPMCLICAHKIPGPLPPVFSPPAPGSQQDSIHAPYTHTTPNGTTQETGYFYYLD